MMRYLPAALAAAVLTGCGTADPRSRSFEVSGTVTYNGRPLPDGDVTLISDDPTLAADGGKITAGRFRFLASAGRKRVEVRASREIPIPPGVVRDPRYEDYVPAKYNERSELSLEVVPGGRNVYEFALEGR
jgi:hypothetical protein